MGSERTKSAVGMLDLIRVSKMDRHAREKEVKKCNQIERLGCKSLFL